MEITITHFGVAFVALLGFVWLLDYVIGTTYSIVEWGVETIIEKHKNDKANSTFVVGLMFLCALLAFVASIYE